VEDQKREKIEIISDVYQLPKLEGMTKKTIIAGRNRVNLYYLSCSCKEYRQSVKNYPRRDIRRICKHLYVKIFAEAESSLDSLSKMLLHNQFWFGQKSVKKIKFYDEIIYAGLHKVNNIASIFKSDDEHHKKYIFDLIVEDWANDDKPFSQPEMNEGLVEFLLKLNGLK
jgi:hypothetical protein